MKKLRIQVQRETLTFIERNKYRFKSSTTKYITNPNLPKINPLFQIKIEVIACDTLEAFGNPAEDIAQMFKSLLMSSTSCGRFEHVVFAVIKI